MDFKIGNIYKAIGLRSEKLSKPLVIDTLQTQKETEIIDKQKILDKSLVAGLVKKSNRIIATIYSHKFPIDLFPDTINVEEGRVTVIDRDFFFSSHVHTVDIKDISNILINTTPFFAQLVIVSMTFTENEVKISNLRQEEAIFIKRIIEGLRIFEEKQIDTSVYSKEELIAKLQELSKTEIVV